MLGETMVMMLVSVLVFITLFVIVTFACRAVRYLYQRCSLAATSPYGFTGPTQDWNVLTYHANHQQAAAMMERLHRDVMKFLVHLHNKYRVDWSEDLFSSAGKSRGGGAAPITSELFDADQLEIVSSLLDNYDYENVGENTPITTFETSYTIKKGESMRLCLRNWNDPSKLVPYEELLFVMLHEMSHIANYNDYGHNDRFWTVFKIMLFEAEEAGIYVPFDYSKNGKMYCGLLIEDSPYFNADLPNLFVPQKTLHAAAEKRQAELNARSD